MRKVEQQREAANSGSLWLLYGAVGVGKTTTLLQSLPTPIMWINGESKQLTKCMKAAMDIESSSHARTDVDLFEKDNVGKPYLCEVVYEDWPDLLEFVSDTKKFDRFASVVVDSLSHLLTAGLAPEIAEQSFAARDKDKKAKPLVDSVKLSLEGFGALAGQALRLITFLQRIASVGKLVVCTAREDSQPSGLYGKLFK